MAVAYESHSIVNFTSLATVTLTKPTGLTAGDLLLVVVTQYGAANQVATPTGWTHVETVSTDGTAKMSMSALAKIATSADVSASDFSFVYSTQEMAAGILYRLSDANIPTVVDSDVVSGSGTITFSGGVTPLTSGLLIGSFGVNLTTAAFSNVAVETDNPTWTSRHNTTSSTGSDGSFASFSAPRTETTATGDYSVSRSGASLPNLGLLISVIPIVNASGTSALHVADPTTFAPTPSAGTSGSTSFLTTDPSFFAVSGMVSDEQYWFDSDKSIAPTWAVQGKEEAVWGGEAKSTAPTWGLVTKSQ